MPSYKDKASKVSSGRNSLIAIITSLTVVGLFAASTIVFAQASVITPEEHWRYNVYWYWDPDERETVGLINPTLVIENETSDKLEGYIADANGTRLDMYDGEQVVKVRYGYDGGMLSRWELGSWIHDGYFTLEIPEKHRDADFISIYVGNNDYTVDDRDLTTRNPGVSINSIRTEYRFDHTLDVEETSTAQLEIVSRTPMPGSLIDQILSKFGLL